MDSTLRLALGAAALVAATTAAAQVTFYEGEGFRGRMFTTNKPVADLERAGVHHARSAVVDGGRWEVCADSGRCVVLRRGSYDSLAAVGLEGRVSSVRPVVGGRHYENEAPVALPEPTYEYRQRPDERLYQAKVVSAHAVGGPPERRCWIEREQVSEPNVGGAIAGAIIGGIIGHQVGGGRGQEAATVGGAVAGAAIGSRMGEGGVSEREVRRCDTAFRGQPDYWDVTYVFRGIEHHVQMSEPPGPTIAVNSRGEPRG